MSPIDLLLFRFLLASCGCVAAGLGVWALTALCRRLPGFSAQRSVWLLGQVTVAAVFLVILLPHSERLRIVPPIELDSVSQSQLASASGPAAAVVASAQEVQPNERSWLALGAQAWLLLYLLGLARAIHQLVQARRALTGLAAAGSPVHDLDQQCGALAVIEVDAPISPMLFGFFRPRLLLPRHLRSLESIQQQLIVEHELTHLRRHDLQWMSAGIVLQTLLWFNPFMRMLRARLSWAQELACDRDVLQGRPGTQRKAYAAALVAQLRLQHYPANTALAFGGVSASTLAERIALIRGPATAHSRWVRLAAAAGLGAIFAGSLAFQPALAWRAEPLSCIEMTDAASGQRLVREGRCDERVTPASTFNIVVSLMGYDSGILRDEHTPSLPFKQGYADWQPSWRATTDPTDWIRNSVVWYAQQVTAQLGAARFQHYVDSFDYGNRNLAGDPGKDNGLAMSWIASSLTISPSEQVAFLRKVVNRELPLSPAAYDMTTRILQPVALPNGWIVHGKTGTASPVLPDGRDDAEHQYGWYVGWATKGQRTIVFARLVQDQHKQTDAAGWRAREAFLRELPARLDAL
jgi:bla regulator protein BlaR1